jgi:hypothetical protein
VVEPADLVDMEEARFGESIFPDVVPDLKWQVLELETAGGAGAV